MLAGINSPPSKSIPSISLKGVSSMNPISMAFSCNTGPIVPRPGTGMAKPAAAYSALMPFFLPMVILYLPDCRRFLSALAN